MGGAEQWLVSVVARARIKVRGNFDDYVGVESVEWAEGIFQQPDIGRCPVQFPVDIIYLESQDGTVIVNPLEHGCGSFRYPPGIVGPVQERKTDRFLFVRESLRLRRRRVAQGKALAQGIPTSMRCA